METRRTRETKGSMSFTGSQAVDLSGRLKKTETASRRSTAGQTSGGAVMAAAVSQADSAVEGARPSSGTGGEGGGRCCAAPGAANRSTVMLDGRHERRRGERRARVTRLGSACRELGEREERLELATDVEESGEASRRDARRDGRRVATDVEKRRRAAYRAASRGGDVAMAFL